MKALVFTRYGGPEAMELREVPVPAPAAGEVLIRVRAAGLNPVDYKTREGALRIIRRHTFPVVAGNELAGVIETLGPGVAGFHAGEPVLARVDKYRMGAFAEFAVVPAEFVARMPDSMDFAQAAGLPLAGLTAWQALHEELRVGPGQRVFISGGAGGVGTIAIQLAKLLGAEVATTASPRGRELVRRLGADTVIDYTQESFADVLHDYDAVLDLVGGKTLREAFRILKPGAGVVSIAGLPEPITATKDLGRGPGLAFLFRLISLGLRLAARRHGVAYRYLFMHPDGQRLAKLAVLVAEGRLEVVIDRTFGFERIADAFAYLEQGRAKGKVIVTFGG